MMKCESWQLICRTYQSGQLVGVCRILFGSLPKPNIRQFCLIFCRSRRGGPFLPNITIRQVAKFMLYIYFYIHASLVFTWELFAKCLARDISHITPQLSYFQPIIALSLPIKLFQCNEHKLKTLI